MNVVFVARLGDRGGNECGFDIRDVDCGTIIEVGENIRISSLRDIVCIVVVIN